MVFDKSRVYTVLNADELKIGSEVIVDDSLFHLKELVESGAETSILKEICPDAVAYRFGVEDSVFAFAYLVSEPVEKVLKWTDLAVGDVIVNDTEGKTRMVTGIDTNTQCGCHIGTGTEWVSDAGLESWRRQD